VVCVLGSGPAPQVGACSCVCLCRAAGGRAWLAGGGAGSGGARFFAGRVASVLLFCSPCRREVTDSPWAWGSRGIFGSAICVGGGDSVFAGHETVSLSQTHSCCGSASLSRKCWVSEIRDCLNEAELVLLWLLCAVLLLNNRSMLWG
jgi:hypothetical protein